MNFYTEDIAKGYNWKGPGEGARSVDGPPGMERYKCHWRRRRYGGRHTRNEN